MCIASGGFAMGWLRKQKGDLPPSLASYTIVLLYKEFTYPQLYIYAASLTL